jgi:N utilization substance protein A
MNETGIARSPEFLFKNFKNYNNMIDIKALKQSLDIIESEKRIPKERIMEAVEASLAAAYKKEYGDKDQVVRCVLNLDTGEMEFFQVKTVVDETLVWMPESEDEEKAQDDERPRYNEEKHLLVNQARLIRKDAEVGSEIIFNLETKDDFGRIAAQTAKQVIVQKFREAEKDSLVAEFAGKEGSIVSGIVQRVEKGLIFIDLGRATAVLPKEEQIFGENWKPGDRIRAYLFNFDESGRGLSLRISRTHPRFLIELFKLEAPEIAEGIVEIKFVAREPGRRSKIAVTSSEEHIDPVGTCIGSRGVRVNQVTQELHGERIDVIEWSKDPADFIADALSPAEIDGLELDDANRTARVYVSPDVYSLAIGRSGQNVRLAAKLTGWRIDIENSDKKEETEKAQEAEESEKVEEKIEVENIKEEVISE